LNYFAPEKNHDCLYKKNNCLLGFNSAWDFKAWQKNMRKKFFELLGELPEKIPVKIKIEHNENNELFHETRYVFNSENFSTVPCHLLMPKNGKKPFPVVVCLQGHSPGMHVSLGRIKNTDEYKNFRNDDYAVQAVKLGFAALTLELRGFGERRELVQKKDEIYSRGVCFTPSMSALLLGRTMAGERIWDVMRAIDTLSFFPDLDPERTACMGHSGGGITAYYTACLDSRIKAVMPVCCICSFEESIFRLNHCACNYIPGILKYFEMYDLAGMIAPRKLIILAGKFDKVFPVSGIKKAFSVIKSIYKKAGAQNNCSLLVYNAGHQFFPEESWNAFRQMTCW
jgi:cephalosporin-C deacetylase-like acetyl esterase